MGFQPWIYLVILGAIAIVYALMLPKPQSKTANHEEVLQEIEGTLDHFMQEIAAENEQLVQLVGQMKQDFIVKQTILQEKNERLEQRLEQLELRCSQLEALREQTASQQAVMQAEALRTAEPQPEATGEAESASSADQAQEAEEQSIKSRYAELFALHEQGKSIDHISKRTGMNRGEIGLILQLAKQEERRV